ncbi:hypothetical protein ACLM5J_18860 [Nocardioides sp. Bht2]|uniref:hypothetical protein n=1 Tax=Nocardioides sp. Bht2 TaxID=3392297 RepID=UPI0039B3FDEA
MLEVEDRTSAVRPMPATVVAAAVITWIVASGTAAATALLAIVFVVLCAPLWEVFGSGYDNPRWWIVGATGIVVLLAASLTLRPC